jgi:hypothetical protein
VLGITFVDFRAKKRRKIMKTLITFLLSFLSSSLLAQNVNITFGGANKSKNYQVVIDGTSYYSANSVSTKGRQMITIPNLTAASHTLAVYNVGNNNNTYSDGTNNSVSGTPLYEKTFQLRQGYDMNISVRANGAVSFTEKRATNQYTAAAGTPMSATAFNQLLINVRNKRYQSDKITMIRNAFNSSANNFTTSQVRQLLLLINSESRRLELAKLSYKKVIDPANFSYVYDVLKSEASRDALDDYVVEHGGATSTTDANAAFGTRSTISTTNFNQLLTGIQNKSYEADKIAEMRNAFGSNYYNYTTAQIRQLLLLVSSETEKLSLAKLAFSHTSDPANFNQLVDLFYTQYNRDELNRFIVSNGGVANTTVARAAMTDASFNQIYTKARSHFFQKNTLNEIKNAFNTTANNFSTEQVKQLLLLANVEADKLALAKLAYPRVVDTGNFSQLLDLFTVPSNRTELEIFINAQH